MQTRLSLRISLILLFLFPIVSLQAQKSDKELQQQIESVIQGFKGDIGIYVKSLKTNKVAAIYADTIFPTASIVKVAILTGIMNKIEKKELEYHQHLSWMDTLNYDPAEDIAGYLKPQTAIELSKVMMLMMTISDNTASLWLQSLAGTGSVINKLMDSLGYKNTQVNSRTPGRESFRNIYGWGQTSPKEMAQIFEDIVLGKLISKSASNKMLRIMGRQYWDEEALSVIPPADFVADKNGAVNASRSEVMYVNGKHPYIFSIFTKNNADISWESTNEAWVLTRKISKMVWEYYNEN
jgi:beta-lactamase class A